MILRGLGIGFNKKPGELVPPEKVEKIYDLRDPEKCNRLMELLRDVPVEFFDVTAEIIETARAGNGKRLSDNIYITLTDHICFAVERMKAGNLYPNQLLWEITNFYPDEFAIGLRALAIIEQKLGYRLSRDEAGFIALHIVNAEIDGRMADIGKITELIGCIVATVQEYYGITLDEQSLDYGRFITHLKFLGQRMLQNKGLHDSDLEFGSMILRRYPHDSQCALRIRDEVGRVCSIQLPQEEMTFLTIHLHRLAVSMGVSEKGE